MDFDTIFGRVWGLYKEQTISFWKPNTSNGSPDQTINADHIFMKMLPEVYLD